jgi:DNA-binding MarR family transcriptional regulator
VRQQSHCERSTYFFGVPFAEEEGYRNSAIGLESQAVFTAASDFTVQLTGLNQSRRESSFHQIRRHSFLIEGRGGRLRRDLSMRVAVEIVQLLVQSAGTWLFEGHRSGLSDREWMALRFLALANRFSKTPTALAGFLGTTRSVASQIAAVLLEKGLVVRKPSAEDKRSITLCVTREGEQFLERDPINVLRDQLMALEGSDRSRLRDTLRRVLVGLDVAERRHHTDVCGQCMFLIESGEEKDRQFKCRLFRKSIAQNETTLLCTHFEARS